MPFAELSVTSNFTFLTGASYPEEMMRRAADLGLPALAIADENSVAGIVRAYISRTSDFFAVAALVFAATARHRETGLSE